MELFTTTGEMGVKVNKKKPRKFVSHKPQCRNKKRKLILLIIQCNGSTNMVTNEFFIMLSRRLALGDNFLLNRNRNTGGS